MRFIGILIILRGLLILSTYSPIAFAMILIVIGVLFFGGSTND